jgi:ubiquinone/menaquinone biosynthesis C-methylase UbiE
VKPTLSCCSRADATEAPSPPLDARVSQEDIGGVYDRLAGVYDIWGVLTESRARNRAIELAGIVNGQTIVEVAVGTGLAFHEIVKRNPGGSNLGIDLSPGMVAKSKRRLAKLPDAKYSLATGSAFALPAESESVDVLVNNYMFDLIRYQDMHKVLAEFRRVLKPGGKLVLVNMTVGETAPSRIYDRIYRISPKTMGGCRGVRLASLLAGRGFAVQVREYHQQMLFPSEVILAVKK